MTSENHILRETILEKAKELDASVVGIARMEDLKDSPSFHIYEEKPFYEEYDPSSSDFYEFKGFDWHEPHQSVLVWGLSHSPSKPVLDWWSMKVPGFTPGNRRLRSQSHELRVWLEEKLGIDALSLPYQVEFGGTFLKDAAHLAGLGVIGKNNLLITPEYGPRVRLRAISLEAVFESTGPIDFDPCKGCDMPCHRACPRDAFRSGSFERPYCKEENDARYDNEELIDGSVMGIDEPSMVMKPCRFCELACPIAK